MTQEPDGETPPDVDHGGEPAVEVSVNVERPKRRVALSYGEHSVEVEGPDELDVLSTLAERLWMLSTPPRAVQFGFGAGSALTTQVVEDYAERASTCAGWARP